MKEGIGVTGREKGKMEGTMEGETGRVATEKGWNDFFALSVQCRLHTYGQ